MQEVVQSPFFNTANNLDYVGSNSEPNFYGADFMSGDERTKFSSFFVGEKNKSFKNKKKLLTYCIDDVKVLRQAYCVFRNLFFKFFKMDYFRQAISISSISTKVLWTMIQRPDSVGTFPSGVSCGGLSDC